MCVGERKWLKSDKIISLVLCAGVWVYSVKIVVLKKKLS